MIKIQKEESSQFSTFMYLLTNFLLTKLLFCCDGKNSRNILYMTYRELTLKIDRIVNTSLFNAVLLTTNN